MNQHKIVVLSLLGLFFIASKAGAQDPSPTGQTADGSEGEVSAQAPDAPEPVLTKRLQVADDGWFQPGLLLQGWMFVRAQHETEFTFRVRRAQLKIQGEIVPDTFAYKVMIDPSRLLKFGEETIEVESTDPANPQQISVPTPPRDTSILQDFYITLLTRYANVSIGQFKIPLSWAGFNSSSKLLMPQRAMVAKKFDGRDVGLRVEQEFEHFSYVAGIFNGEERNRLDANNQKDLTLRLEAYPIEGLMLGAVGYASLGERDEVASTKDRIEADARFERGGALAQAEYIRGWDGPTGARVESHGAYGAFAYTFAEAYQPVVRVGFLDEDLDTESDTSFHYEAGFNYYILEHHVKLQASYSLFDSQDAEDIAHEGILSAQLAF